MNDDFEIRAKMNLVLEQALELASSKPTTNEGVDEKYRRLQIKADEQLELFMQLAEPDASDKEDVFLIRLMRNA